MRLRFYKQPKTNNKTNKCKNSMKENYNNLINVNKLKVKYHLMKKLFFKIPKINRKN